MAPDHSRAREIIRAYGGDSRRWPDAERQAVAALVEGDAALRGELQAAVALDAELAAWAKAAVAPVRFDAGSLPGRVDRRWRWWGGGAVAAAAVAAGIAVLAPMRLPVTLPNTVAVGAPVATVADSEALAGAAIPNEADSFSYVFTPTDDEESLI